MDKFIVVSKKQNTILADTMRTFSTMSDAEKHIELKTRAGMVCHLFNYSTTYQSESRLTQANVA